MLFAGFGLTIWNWQLFRQTDVGITKEGPMSGKAPSIREGDSTLIDELDVTMYGDGAVLVWDGDPPSDQYIIVQATDVRDLKKWC